MSDLDRLRRFEEAVSMIRLLPDRMLSEEVEIGKALGRIVGHDLYAPEDLPHFSRSIVDGYAVAALETRSAQSDQPIKLKLTGELRLGATALQPLTPQSTVKVAAGGMLPPGADAVVMADAVQLAEEMVKISTPVVPGENLIPVGSDVRADQLVLKKGCVIRPQDVGILAALGFDRLYVMRKPRVGILSTGDELVEITEDLKPGRVRDLNTYTLSSLVHCNYGIPVPGGIVPDDRTKLRQSLDRSLAESDLVVVTGTSSAKVRTDLQEIISAIGTVLCDGIEIRPGKTTLIGRVGGKLVFGLPGYPVSAMMVFELLVKPYMELLLNFRERHNCQIKARIQCDIAGTVGCDEFIKVRLEERDAEYWAIPIAGEVALISTLVQADGMIQIPYTKDRLVAGEIVEVKGFSEGCR